MKSGSDMIHKNASTSIEVLSKKDAFRLLEVIYASHSCSNEKDFRQLIKDLKYIVPFDFAACLMGRKSIEKDITQYELINISYPDEWLYHYVTKKYHLVDPIVKANFTNYSLQYWQDTYKKYSVQKQFVKEAEDFKLNKGYSVGQRNRTQTEGSLFSFAGISLEHKLRTEIILKHIAPHLHEAFNNVLVKERKPGELGTVTSREKEVLLWLKEGKSSWEISVILSISQDTVNYHVQNIYRKLNACSRAHAVAIALGKMLIEF